MVTIKISKDFSKELGCRYRKDGVHSGEEFRDDLLIHKFYEAVRKQEPLFIDFDDTYGIGRAWLDEAFGGLALKYGIVFLGEILIIKSDDDETLEEYLRNIIFDTEDSIFAYALDCEKRRLHDKDNRKRRCLFL